MVNRGNQSITHHKEGLRGNCNHCGRYLRMFKNSIGYHLNGKIYHKGCYKIINKDNNIINKKVEKRIIKFD
jgi:hypothetical protein